MTSFTLSSSTTQQHLSEDFFTIPLSTYRDQAGDGSKSFPYDSIISAIAIVFFRTTIFFWKKEPLVIRYFFGLLLGLLTLLNKSYELLYCVEIFSYIVPYILSINTSNMKKWSTVSASTKTKTSTSQQQQQQQMLLLLRIVLIAISAILTLLVCRICSNGTLLQILQYTTPTVIQNGLCILFPITEIYQAYDIINEFVPSELLNEDIARLFFITFHIQIGIGYIGIDFLKKEQERRNQLVRMDIATRDDDDDDTEDETSSPSSATTSNNKTRNDKRMQQQSRRFQRTAAPFIFFTAVPYMIKVIGYGNLNAFAYVCFKDDVHRHIRLHDLFDHDNNLVALAEHSAKSPAGKILKIPSHCWCYCMF
jgi:hypothetical protein